MPIESIQIKISFSPENIIRIKHLKRNVRIRYVLSGIVVVVQIQLWKNNKLQLFLLIQIAFLVPSSGILRLKAIFKALGQFGYDILGFAIGFDHSLMMASTLNRRARSNKFTKHPVEMILPLLVRVRLYQINVGGYELYVFEVFLLSPMLIVIFCISSCTELAFFRSIEPGLYFLDILFWKGNQVNDWALFNHQALHQENFYLELIKNALINISVTHYVMIKLKFRRFSSSRVPVLQPGYRFSNSPIPPLFS